MAASGTPTSLQQAGGGNGVAAPFFSFVVKKSNGATVQKSRPLISGRHFMTAINQKYADESSLASGNILGDDNSALSSN